MRKPEKKGVRGKPNVKGVLTDLAGFFWVDFAGHSVEKADKSIKVTVFGRAVSRWAASCTPANITTSSTS